MDRVFSAICGETKILGIIGCPITHSLSPVMQNSALQACGLDYVYIPFEVSPHALETAVAGLKALSVAGFNVTIPHKARIMQYLDILDESAEAAGAVNTVASVNGKLIGFNTDGDGLVRSLLSELEFSPLGASVALVGAGGAARGAVAALCRSGVKNIIIANRTKESAVELVSLMRDRFSGTQFVVADSLEDFESNLSQVDALINTTSLGMGPDTASFLNIINLSAAAVVYDMVYSPPVTPLLNAAKSRGIRHANGLGMLAAQGELGFKIWTGITPPLGMMKATLDSICRN